jgi:hypothetical protein
MPSYSGSGESVDDPIIISDVDGHFDAINAEYSYLRKKYGERGVEWWLVQQSLLGHEGKQIDAMEIKLKSGDIVILYFDITKYFGQF